MADPQPSRCPRCGARGVKQYQPIVLDGVPTDRPYCGVCGKNYPEDPPAHDLAAWDVTTAPRPER